MTPTDPPPHDETPVTPHEKQLTAVEIVETRVETSIQAAESAIGGMFHHALSGVEAAVHAEITRIETITTKTVTSTTVIETAPAGQANKPIVKQKVAILGGGVGSMTTAFHLTSAPDWQDRYDITLYQMGWRLGGKGASGRGPNGRIEEHGLHIWLGFYDNAFQMMRTAYDELKRPAGASLATFDDAFIPHNYIGVAEQVNGEWKNWMLNFPTNDLKLGQPDVLPTLWEYIQMTLKLLADHYASVAAHATHLQEDCTAPNWFAGLMHHAIQDAENLLTVGCLSVGEMLLRGAQRVAESLPPDPAAHTSQDHHLLLRFLKEFLEWLRARVHARLDLDDELRRLWIYTDLANALIRGVIADGVMYHEDGLDIIDDLDFRAWLQKHGASAMGYNSGLVQGLYDLVFAYHNGEVTRPSFAAGAALRSLLRIDFTYKGSVFQKMRASMGDTIFTPLYRVLKARGVKFEFFHRVENLGLSEDKSRIETIQIAQQVTLINPDGMPRPSGEYDPLVSVKGLDCWPSQPDYAQIAQGADLQNGIVNGVQVQKDAIRLESFWTPWQDAGRKTLNLGEDFDVVVLGIAIGALPYICPELIAASSAWQAMTQNVETVRTIAMQLWLDPSLEALGWTGPSPVIDGYAEPQNTWADMTYLTALENWPAGKEPGSVAYYCGPMPGGIPPRSEQDAPVAALATVVTTNKDWLQTNSGYLWPKAAPKDNPAGLDWDLLTDTENGVGEARFSAQYSRVNMDPSERYVLSVAGSTRYRLRAGESGFANLYLAGDWIQNEFNMGCVEATVMSGMQCSHALSGYPALEDIVGQFHP